MIWSGTWRFECLCWVEGGLEWWWGDVRSFFVSGSEYDEVFWRRFSLANPIMPYVNEMCGNLYIVYSQIVYLIYMNIILSVIRICIIFLILESSSYLHHR